MALVERIGRAEREPDPVQAQRVGSPAALEPAERRAAGAEEILAVDLEEPERGTALEDLGVVRGTQPDADRASTP